jgi:hypothetical protein
MPLLPLGHALVVSEYMSKPHSVVPAPLLMNTLPRAIVLYTRSVPAWRAICVPVCGEVGACPPSLSSSVVPMM